MAAISRGSSSHWELKRSGTRPEIKVNDRLSTEDVHVDIYSCFHQMLTLCRKIFFAISRSLELLLSLRICEEAFWLFLVCVGLMIIGTSEIMLSSMYVQEILIFV